MSLRDVEVRSFKPQLRAYKRTDERGLYLEIYPNGSKRSQLGTAIQYPNVSGHRAV